MTPSYLALHRSGDLARRARTLALRLAECDLCPRRCAVDRSAGEVGFCGIRDRAVVASASPHFGEESPLVGSHGSGTIFFSGCNLKCQFCQNSDISMSDQGQPVDATALAEIMLALQARGCHNINFVTPTHVVPMIIQALVVAADNGLAIPLVYNTGGYDSTDVIDTLAGIIDIYMPDAKFSDDAVAERLTGAATYTEVNRAALRAMHGQVGDLVIDADGLAVGGLLVRHLVMPEDLAGTASTMAFLAALSPATYVNLMGQYHPCYRASRLQGLGRGVSVGEMELAYTAAYQAGITRLDQRLSGREVNILLARS